MGNVLFIVVLIILFIIVAIVLPQWMLIRTAPKVIRIFREHNAVGPKSARTIAELGLQSKGMLEKMFRMRDYKPRTLQFLMKIAIIEMDEEGKVYLDEEKLTHTRWRML